MFTTLALLAALATPPADPLAAPPVAAAQQQPITTRIRVSPGRVDFPDGPVDTADPIARAFDRAGPGCTIELAPGQYPSFGIGFGNARGWQSNGAGGERGRPVVVQAAAGVTIVPAGRQDTISVGPNVPAKYVRFENLDIDAGPRAAVMFYDLPDDRSHAGFEFVGCRIDGRYDHATKQGPVSKWGVLGHDLEEFVFKGGMRRASVRNIRHEHAFYLQNPRGDLTLEQIDASELGRTFVQVTARERSGPPGSGLITVRDCDVRDIGLGEWDGFKGGSAYTFAGRLANCTILVQDCKYRAGFEPKLRALTGPQAPYGTGALVAWGGGESAPMNGTLVLRGNDFEFAEGCGDRPLVSIGACQHVVIEADNRFVAGAYGIALALDPTDEGGRPKDPTNTKVRLAEGAELVGRVTLAGRPVDAETRSRLGGPDREG